MNFDPDWLDRLFGRRFRWKLRRFQENLSRFQWEVKNRLRVFQSRHKMCPQCRQLVERRSATCPACGYRFGLLESIPGGRTFSGTFQTEIAATPVIIGVNVVLYVAGLMLSGASAFAPGQGLFGLFAASMDVHERLGLADSLRIFYYGEYWRIITANFLHGGIVHIFFNMSWLAYLGSMVERNLGRQRFVALYFVAGVGGIGTSVLTHDLYRGLGASGAVCGLIGSTLAYTIVHRHDVRQYALRKEMIRVVIFVLMFGLLMPGIDNVAHVAGGILGAVVTLIGGATFPRGKRQRSLWDLAESTAIGLTLAAFIVMIFHGG